MCQVLLTISERVIEGLPVQAAGDNNTVIYYDYTVEEVSVPAGYSSSTASSVGYTYKFTNTHRLTLPVAGAGGDMMMTLTGVLIVIFGVLTFGKKKKTQKSPSRRPSHILCKPPIRCKIETPNWRFYKWQERNAHRKKMNAERKFESYSVCQM